MAVFAATEAHAHVMCEVTDPCHDKYPEPFIMYAMAAEAFSVGFVGTIGNAALLASKGEPGVGWLAVGYVGAIYNFVLGVAWSSIGGESLLEWPHDEYAKSQIAIGLSHIAMGTISLSVTMATHAKRDSAPGDAGIVMVPAFVPAPGGGSVVLAGEF